MRLIPILLVAALAAAPAAAQKLGARTATPQQVLGEIAPADPMAEAERIAAAAAVHPLGSVENPVRVGGPQGARAYIARLRCVDGSRPQVGARSTGAVGAYGTLTERYPLDCGAAAPGRVALAFDFYHEEHVETRPPAGFALDAR
jgi:hypothetical protein